MVAGGSPTRECVRDKNYLEVLAFLLLEHFLPAAALDFFVDASSSSRLRTSIHARNLSISAGVTVPNEEELNIPTIYYGKRHLSS